MEQSKPQETFFGTRELVERLISLLDIQTTLRLAQSVVNQDILRESLGSKAWRELIKRGYGENGELEEEDVKNLVKILKILKSQANSFYLFWITFAHCPKKMKIGKM